MLLHPCVHPFYVRMSVLGGFSMWCLPESFPFSLPLAVHGHGAVFGHSVGGRVGGG